MAQTSEDQGVIQQPDVAKDPEFVFGVQKDTAWPIEENIECVIMFKCTASVSQWVALKHGRVCALIFRATQIKVRVLLEGDTCSVLVAAKVPKNLWKRRTGTEFL